MDKEQNAEAGFAGAAGSASLKDVLMWCRWVDQVLAESPRYRVTPRCADLFLQCLEASSRLPVSHEPPAACKSYLEESLLSDLERLRQLAVPERGSRVRSVLVSAWQWFRQAISRYLHPYGVIRDASVEPNAKLSHRRGNHEHRPKR